MSFWSRLFKSFKTSDNEPSTEVKKSDLESEGWRPLTKYIQANDQDRELVSVIATSIAAGDSPESEFRIKSVMVRNPEYERVALISAAIAAGDGQEVELRVKNIYEK